MPPGLAERLIDPFVGEAQAALAEGIVADADLVDAGAIFGTGFAPFTGGPLHYAAPRTSCDLGVRCPVNVQHLVIPTGPLDQRPEAGAHA